MNNSKKLYFKIGLDLIMLLLLITFFNKRVISMSFHEIGGIAFFILFIVHILLNIDWIKSVTSKLFKKGSSIKLIISWITNLLLFIDLTGIIITGISMNKTLPFKLSIISHPQQLHYFLSALLIVLIGIHLGLHWPMFKGLLSKITWLSSKPARIILLIILSVTVISGGYNLASGSFSRWISGPFITMEEGDFQKNERFHGDFEGMEKPETGNNKMDRESAKGMDRHGSENFSFLNLLLIMFTFFSEMTVFAIITVLVSNSRKLIFSKNRNITKD